MHIIKVQCANSRSFRYSVLLYLYYYNMNTNRTRVSQLEKNIKPHFPIKCNNNNDLCQFEKDNNNINLLVNNVFLVDMNDRYGIVKPSLERFNDNINAINKMTYVKIIRWQMKLGKNLG